MTPETVTIVHPKQPGQSRVINASDYDPAVHTLWSDRPRAKDVYPDIDPKFLKPEPEAIAPQPQDISDLGLSEARDLVAATESVELLMSFLQQESDRPRPRKTVLEAIAEKVGIDLPLTEEE